MIISINAEKLFGKIQHPFLIKTVYKLEIEGNIFDLRSEKRKRYPFSPLLFNLVLKVVTSAIREEKEIKVF